MACATRNVLGEAVSRDVTDSPPSQLGNKMLRPAYDAHLVEDAKRFSQTSAKDFDLAQFRAISDGFSNLESILAEFPQLEHHEYTISATQGDIILSTFKDKSSKATNRPAIYSIHGGGQIGGNRFSLLGPVIGCVAGIDAVVVSVEYRLAPEHLAPAGLNDAYEGLVWIAEHAEELGIDASKIILQGSSGGGPLAAACATMCRDAQKPFPLAQMLLTPMLDDRDETVASKQFFTDAPWSGEMNRKAWDLALGAGRGGPDVTHLQAPARATDLLGVAPAFIDVGECEVFRDEAVAYASQLWACGVSAELHVWPGAFHGFDAMNPRAPVSRAARATKMNWVRRVLDLEV